MNIQDQHSGEGDHREGLLKRVPLFSELPPNDLRAVGLLVRKRCFGRNCVILKEEDTHHFMYIVFSGKVKVVQSSANGSETILAIREKGDFFGEMSLLDGKTSPAAVVALEESTIGIVSREDFHGLLLTNPNVAQRIIALLCSRLREAWLVMKVVRHPRAEQRVRGVLGHLGTNHGVRDSRGVILTLKLTHEQIAGYASVSRETVTRLMKRFVADEEIELLDTRQIVLRTRFFQKASSL